MFVSLNRILHEQDEGTDPSLGINTSYIRQGALAKGLSDLTYGDSPSSCPSYLCQTPMSLGNTSVRNLLGDWFCRAEERSTGVNSKPKRSIIQSYNSPNDPGAWATRTAYYISHQHTAEVQPELDAIHIRSARSPSLPYHISNSFAAFWADAPAFNLFRHRGAAHELSGLDHHNYALSSASHNPNLHDQQHPAQLPDSRTRHGAGFGFRPVQPSMTRRMLSRGRGRQNLPTLIPPNSTFGTYVTCPLHY